MSGLPPLITDLTVILIIAALTTMLCKKLNLPSVLGYILAGVLTGPVVGFVPTISDMEGIELWSEIGVIFLMFGLGLEFSIHKMKEVGLSGILSAVIQVAGMGFSGFLLGSLLGWDTMNSVFLGVMLAMSSTMIAMKSIEDMGLKDREFSELAMGTLVIEDILAIFAMVILSTVSVSQNVQGLELFSHIGLLVLYLVVWFVLGIYLLPTVMNRLVGLMNDEMLLVFALGICFVMAVLAHVIGFSTELGAFLAGSLLAGTIHAERIEHLVLPCKNLFGAVFFVSVGFKVEPALIVKYIGIILLIAVFAILGKMIFLILGGVVGGRTLDVSMQSAASQTQVGEFSFIIAGLGQSLSVTAPFLYPVIVAVSVLTTFTTTFVLKLSIPLCKWIKEHLPEKWMNALDAYCAARSAEKDEYRTDWACFLQQYLTTFGLFGMLSCALIILGVGELVPILRATLAGKKILADALSCICIYMILVLLLFAMTRVKKSYFTALWLEGLANRVMLIALVAIRFSVAVVLFILPAFLIFGFSPLWLTLTAIPTVLFIRRSQVVAGKYLEVQARFLANINQRKLMENLKQMGERTLEDHQWLTELITVAKLQCPKDYKYDGVTLQDLAWGHVERAKIIHIIRGKEHIVIPRGFNVVKSGDLLVIMGLEKEVDNFCLLRTAEGMEEIGQRQTLKEYIESQDDIAEASQLLCCGIPLRREDPRQGKSLRESGIKPEWGAFLVGIERNALPIPDPSPNIILRPGDILWVIGSQDMAGKLHRLGLLD